MMGMVFRDAASETRKAVEALKGSFGKSALEVYGLLSSENTHTLTFFPELPFSLSLSHPIVSLDDLVHSLLRGC
ncbi:hypothetical protein L1887_20412 [Cichorium endivia]|nr:hypothetical protein L1887_20412 [Cichorium endivia]